MKKQIILAALVLGFLTQQTNIFSQEKGYLSIAQSPTATPDLYQKVVEKLTAANIWETGWTFHALGKSQPTGLFSVGVFPDKMAFETRMLKAKEIYKADNLSVPDANLYEIHNIARPPFPAAKPENAVLIFHDVKNMTPEQYDQILKDLAASKAFPDPGQLFHVCFKTPEGLKVVDIWDSPESLQRFSAVIVPILTKVFGAEPPQPQVFALHNVVSESKNARTMMGNYMAFGRGDVPSILATLAPDCSWSHPGNPSIIPFAGTFRGPAEIGSKFFAAIPTAVQITEFLPMLTFDNGKTVVHTVKIKGKGIATGKWYENTAEMKAIFNDAGLIEKYEIMVDPSGLEAALTK